MRDSRATTNADQVDLAERRMWGGAPLQKLVVTAILIGDKVRVQRVVLAIIEGNTHNCANGHRRNGAIAGQMLAEFVFRYNDMNRRRGLSALRGHNAQRKGNDETLHGTGPKLDMELVRGYAEDRPPSKMGRQWKLAATVSSGYVSDGQEMLT